MIENFKKKYLMRFKAYQMEMLKKLTGNEIPPIFRIRVSKYRILFHMNEYEIQILKVDSRGDIYQ